MRETPLINVLRKLGANIGEFAGCLTAMDYGNPLEEHVKTRKDVTIFDVSHMGRYVIRGDDIFEFFQKLVARDLRKFREGRMSGPVLILNEEGGIIDDIMLYYVKDTEWIAVVNAPNIVKDKKWMELWARKWGYNVRIEDITNSTTLIAIQGPNSPQIIHKLGIKECESLDLLEFINDVPLLNGRALIVSRSGWTGEEVRSYGYEIIASVDLGRKIFEEAVKLGAKPAGLIARDSLRLEAGYPLIGVDISEEFSPIEARYWLGISLNKEEFIGRDGLLRKYKEGASRFRYGVRLKKGVRKIPRHGNKIVIDGAEVGFITSGSYSPILNRGIGMAYVNASHAYVGGKVKVRIHGREYEAKILDFPLI